MKIKILIVLFFLFFSFNLAFAIGIGAKPSFLDLELRTGQSKQTKILVYNLSQEAGIFQVFPDELNDWIKIEPDNFRLEAGENKVVKITVSAKGEGRKVTNLSILASPLEKGSFSVGPGLKIPIRLNIEKEKSIFLASVSAIFNQNRPLLIIIGILIICLIWICGIKYFRRQKKTQPPENLPIES